MIEEQKNTISEYVRDQENLFSQSTIDTIEDTLSKIRGLNIRGKNEESVLVEQLFEHLSKDDIGKKLLKIYKIKSKVNRDDLYTLIYLRDLCSSIEIAIIEANDENILSFIKKLVYDFIDNYNNFDEDEAFLKGEFATLDEYNNYGIDYANRNVLRVFLEKSFDLTEVSTSLQISLIVRICSEGRKFNLPDFQLEGLFSDKAISEIRRMLGVVEYFPTEYVN